MIHVARIDNENIRDIHIFSIQQSLYGVISIDQESFYESIGNSRPNMYGDIYVGKDENIERSQIRIACDGERIIILRRVFTSFHEILMQMFHLVDVAVKLHTS